MKQFEGETVLDLIVQTENNTLIFFFVNSQKPNERKGCEMFGIDEIKKINVNKDGFTLCIYPDRPIYFKYNPIVRDELIKKLTGIAEQRFRAGLQVYRCYPNIEIPKFEKQKSQ